MSTDVTFITFLVSAAIAFALGAVPVAYIVGKLNGVNIFEVGSRQAGATNVWREVSRKHGVIVSGIDVVKGTAAILVAQYMGLVGVELLVPAAAVVGGHWNSPFTKFKGGDGVATMMGAAVGIAPPTVFIGFAVGLVIAITMNRKLNHPSLFGGIAGYAAFIALSFRPNSTVDPGIVYGLTGMGIAIVLHSMYFHKRHKEYFRTDISIEDEDPEQTLRQDGLG
jgi:acyl phosphate:glycerol-3-phosphate acyltransferase